MKFDPDTTTSELGKTPRPSAQRVSLVIYARAGVKVVPLDLQGPVVVGRGARCEISIEDPSVSRRHACFSLLDQQVCVEDLGSSNGTLVNGEQITQVTPVRPGEEVRLGGVSVGIALLGETESRHRDVLHHDRFVTELEDEVSRARAFGRSLGLINVRPEPRGVGQIGRWFPTVQALLQPFHRVGLFGADEIEIAIPEPSREALIGMGQGVVQAARCQGVFLLCGIGVFPDCAASSEELLEVTRRATKDASRAVPVQLAPAHGVLPALNLTTLGEGEEPIVHGEAMVKLFHTVRRLAARAIPVLIQGETGTGKEVVARALHRASPRRERRMLCVNCGAIPSQLLESALFGHERGAFTGAHTRARGIFEEAEGGTVLLDEVGELSPNAQVALLRVLETRRVNRVGSHQEIPVDVRILAATNCELEQMCHEGRFRWDLLYRLNTMVLRVPPLRERPEELEPLVAHFIRQANTTNGCAVTGINTGAAELLRRYFWPGNVRELRNAIERAVVLTQCGEILAETLPERVQAMAQYTQSWRRGGIGAVPTMTLPSLGPEEVTDFEVPLCPPRPESGGLMERLFRWEQALLLAALHQARWNHVETARALGLPLRTLFHKVKRYGLKEAAQDLPESLLAPARLQLASGRPWHELLQRFEAELLREALEQAAGDHDQAAVLLHISVRTLRRHLRSHGLD